MTHGRVEGAPEARRRRTRTGRGLLACVLLFAISSTSGCMVMDELDSARRGVSARPDTEARAAELLLAMASRVEALAARLENET